MKKIIICIILTIILTTSSHANNITANAKTDYNIAKTLFLNKNYEKSTFIFYKIILQHNQYNNYVKKSKLYLILTKYNLNKLNAAKTDVKSFTKMYNESKYLNYAFYIHAAINYKISNNILFKSLPLKKFKRDQTKTQKSLNILKKMNSTQTKNLKIKKLKKKLKNELRNNVLYITKYYLKKKLYITALNRTPIQEKTKSKHFFCNTFITIKSYNELFLNKISKHILEYTKNI